MYYRRKVLLALIDAFGGRLGKTDCEKLLFLFCQTTQRNYYDFFPYHYGGFSLVSYYDKKVLTGKGFLKAEDDFALVTDEKFIEQVKPDDKKVLLILAKQVKESGDNLIRKIYLEYPSFTCRSNITSRLLNSEEVKRVSLFWNVDENPCLFTLGYEGLSIDAYLNKLIVNNIHALIDVRNNPFSMKYGFSNPGFQNHVERVGIAYYHVPELGIPSELRKKLGTKESYMSLFKYYEEEILPHNLVHIEKIKQRIHDHSRVALTCFEQDFRSCHRHKVIEILQKQGYGGQIIHVK
jgi:uncharacterized protein (DUF488 family)